MGKFLESKRREHEFVVARIGGMDKSICTRCPATLDTFADVCPADLDDLCPGFKVVDEAKSEFYRKGGRS